MPKRLTFEYVQQYYNDRGCELLEKQYKNNKTKMRYRCGCGSVSLLDFHNFRKGGRCIDCTGGRLFTTEEFVKRARKVHKDEYDYSKVCYKNIFSRVVIICPIHGDYEQTPHQHLRGHSCELCSRKLNAEKRSKSIDDFVKDAKRIHGDKYDYKKVDYKTDKIKVIIVCPTHGEFEQVPRHHLKGCGCPHCKFKNEGKVKKLLLKYFDGWTIICHKKIWDKYKNYDIRRNCDFWLEKNNIKIIVEYDGQQHFKPVRFNGISAERAEKLFKANQLKDKLDKDFCRENNIILHRIKYNESKEESIKRLISDYNLTII